MQKCHLLTLAVAWVRAFLDTTPICGNQTLAPYRSKELELGFKTDAHPIAITTALFRLQRPFADTLAFHGCATQTIL